MMIDGETGEQTIRTLVKSQDEVREDTDVLQASPYWIHGL